MTDRHTEHALALRSAGLNVTAQRIAILDTVSHHPHSTADDIYQVVTERLGSISHQAIYDTLSALSERGLLRRIQPSHSPARFETRVGDNHHHLICRTCGDVRDVDCAVHRTPCLTASDNHGFSIDEAEVIYWGICPTCTAADATARG
ncbi:MAG: Fur family transcriptional regulator [Actinomycetota bacterium]|nr:Fur family transcriptional regulator [Actinomycetota bacterium]